MTDIVERLREPVWQQVRNAAFPIMREAADEIARLRAALENDEFDADLCAENDNMRVEIERLRASELAWKLMAEKNDEWNAQPQSEKEASLRKALDDEVGEGLKKDEEIERLLAHVASLEEQLATCRELREYERKKT
jgi:hypothetical protein